MSAMSHRLAGNGKSGFKRRRGRCAPLLLPRADYVTRIAGGRGAGEKFATYYSWRRANWMKPKGIDMSKARRWVIIVLSLAVLV